MKYQWKYKDDMSNNYYHDENGRIVGEITRVNFSDDIWHATVGDNKLGEYINNKTARKAVEKDIENGNLFIFGDMKQASEDFNPRDDYNNGYSGNTIITATWNESQLGENH